MDDLKEFIEDVVLPCLVVFMILVILSAPIMWGVFNLRSAVCDNQWSAFPHKFGIVGGCMVDATGSGVFVPDSHVRVWGSN